jgi:DUF971 family protein
VHPIKIQQPSPHQLAITWQDGTVSMITTRTLRINCPCTECRSTTGMTSATYIPMMTTSAITIRDMELIGSSALRVMWEDGHSMSIYRYDYLRRIAPPQPPDAQ